MDKVIAKQVIDAMFYEMWNKKNAEVANQIFSDNFEVHYSVHVLNNMDEFKSLLRQWFTAIPDLVHTIDDYIIEENKIVARWHGEGTHLGEFMGIAPTGKRFYYGGITILLLQPDSKITRAWVYNDLTDMLIKLKES